MNCSSNIRNFCIIAHIDHGKSTLADRLLEMTNTISEREKRDQILDSMDLERERGITIKMQPVTMLWREYILNLIDTPGHADFNYEVSRAIAAVEGAVLLVDASQGVQAQTLANLYLALEQNLAIIPVINKIDLSTADILGTKNEISSLLGIPPDQIIAISAKTGQNVEAVIEAVVSKIPAPQKKIKSLNTKQYSISRALIFDSYYDSHHGVVCDVRIFDGEFKTGDQIMLYQSRAIAEVYEIGIYTPKQLPKDCLIEGEIGYIITGLKEVAKCSVGDTIFKSSKDIAPLPGYKKVQPVVFASIYPKDQSKYIELKRALEQLRLNDSSLLIEPSYGSALGKGLQIGVLGLLHLDIVKERILREYGIDVLMTVPHVEYHVKIKGREDILVVKSPQDFPDISIIKEVLEPWADVEIVAPSAYVGDIIQLVIARRGEYKTIEYLNNQSVRVLLHFTIPMAELITDFYDKLKNISQGYSSLHYDIADMRCVDLVKVEFLASEEKIEAFSILAPRSTAYKHSRRILEILAREIPPHLFEIRLQAVIRGLVIASERIRALKKNVTAKLYGGDVTRKMKLLKKQKKGKKKMLMRGKVQIPSSVYLEVLKAGSE